MGRDQIPNVDAAKLSIEPWEWTKLAQKGRRGCELNQKIQREFQETVSKASVLGVLTAMKLILEHGPIYTEVKIKVRTSKVTSTPG